VRIEMHVDKSAISRLEKYIKRRIAEKTKDVGLNVYNTIVLDLVDSPYYSGSYISSWRISAGLPTFSYNESAGLPNQYTAPNPKLDLGGVMFGQKVYITNSAPHAKQVEYEGTPRHEGGWFTATHAKNVVVMSYKFLKGK
jgi:hypothetical protein